MQRMMIEDFKRIMPEAEITFACLPEYRPAAENHPFIDKVENANTVQPQEYIMCYNTCVTVADRYENKMAPYCHEHRADIWAAYCGLELTKHEMHLNLPQEQKDAGRKRMEKFRKPGTPLVAFAPVSKMTVKTLEKWQIDVILDELSGCSVVALHNKKIDNIQGIYDSNLWEWMGCIDAADYVISVDTAAFHLAGGLKKPLVGIFTFADGKVYGKHFDFVLVQKHRDNGNWPCGPCFKFGDCPKCKKQPKPCLTELTEDEFRQGIKTMFRRWPWSNFESSSNNYHSIG
jgi:ADP-heptose:LPS heptosyltransferase